MRRPLAALVVSVYAVPVSLAAAVCLMLLFDAGAAALVLPLAAAGVSFALMCVSVWTAKRRPLTFRAVLTYKLALVPFFALNFLFWGFSLMVFHLALIALPLLPFVMLYDWLLVLSFSTYNMHSLARLRQSGAVSGRFRLAHTLLQMCFVIDVIDSCYLVIKIPKNSPKLTQKPVDGF